MFEPTPQQRQALDAFSTGQSLKIEACAGSGKTATLKLLAESTRRRGVYLAFNNAIKEEAKQKFPRHVRCITPHGLAYQVYGRQMAHRLSGSAARLTPRLLAQTLGMPSMQEGLHREFTAGVILRTIRRFCQSASPTIGLHHMPEMENASPDQEQALRLVLPRWLKRTWEAMSDPKGTMTIEHDVYLKCWALSEPKAPAAFVLFDEAQDANPLQLGLLERWRNEGAQIVIVGDRYQQIYSWRGAINAMSNFETQHTVALTRSFRYGPKIAQLANSVLTHYREVPSHIEGAPHIEAVVELEAGEPCEAILCRGNATVINELMHALLRGHQPYIAGGIDDLKRLIEGTIELKVNKSTRCPDLASFKDWSEVEQFAQTEEGQDLQVLVRLVKDYDASSLLATLERISGNTPKDATLTLSTAHKAKGLEWSSVKLASDFPSPFDAQGESSSRWSDEEAHLLYVALTRAQHRLDISECAVAIEAYEKIEQLRSLPKMEDTPTWHMRLEALAAQLGLTPDETLTQLIDAYEARHLSPLQPGRQGTLF